MMNGDSRDYFAEIGQLMVQIADDAVGDIFLYGMVEDAAYTVQLYYPIGDGKRLRYKVPADLGKLVYEFWEAWKETPGEKEWRRMCYIVKKRSEIDVKFVYPDQITGNVNDTDWRNAELKKSFGDIPIDPSWKKDLGFGRD